MKKTHSRNDTFAKNSVLGVGFSNASKEQILEFIIRGLGKKGEKFYVVTPNPELLVIANKNTDYKRVLNNARIASVDGIGVRLAGSILGIRLGQRFPGVGMLETLCERLSKRPITVGFLGAGPGVAELAAECLREKYPGLKVVFAQEEWDSPIQSSDSRINNQKLAPGKLSFAVSQLSQESGVNSQESIDLLFVAFGSPKQELWIAENLDKLPVKVAIGVGGAFDLISGRVKRAPRLFQTLGVEWFWRLLIQPWRIKRQLSLITFLFLVFKERLSAK
jgi:N-acetylglucosaminyldiphosphoundecaprenol N-acetyl-beta-D-mannosaminyltransferase